MKRMHIHVAVEDLNDSIQFYRAIFGNTKDAGSANDTRPS
jgi:predicted enzyme related to lactoylglutathione lyase